MIIITSFIIDCRNRFRREKDILSIVIGENESLNSQFRKVSNSRSVYPSEGALLKALFLFSKHIMKKWNQKVRGWEGILRMLLIEYGECLEKYLK